MKDRLAWIMLGSFSIAMFVVLVMESVRIEAKLMGRIENLERVIMDNSLQIQHLQFKEK